MNINILIPKNLSDLSLSIIRNKLEAKYNYNFLFTLVDDEIYIETYDDVGDEYPFILHDLGKAIMDLQ